MYLFRHPAGVWKASSDAAGSPSPRHWREDDVSALRKNIKQNNIMTPLPKQVLLYRNEDETVWHISCPTLLCHFHRHLFNVYLFIQPHTSQGHMLSFCISLGMWPVPGLYLSNKWVNDLPQQKRIFLTAWGIFSHNPWLDETGELGLLTALL